MAQKRKRRKKRKNGILAKIIVTAFVIYSVANLITLQVQINAQRDNVKALKVQIAEEQLKNEQLTTLLDKPLDEEYIVSVAQNEGYAASSSERVFIDVSE